MAAPSGLDAQFCIAREVTHGVYAAPTRALEFNEESLALDQPRIESGGRRTGGRVMRTNRTRINRKGVGGSSTHEVTTAGFGLLFEHALGAIATSQPDAGGAPTVYLHTATVGALTGKSLTVQVGRPDIQGVVRPFSYLGCKIASWELSCEVDGLLTFTPTWDGVDETTGEALVAATYPAADDLFDFVGASLTIDGTAVPVRNFTLSGDNALNTERYFMRESSLKDEQLEAAKRAYTGTLEAEFDALTLYDLFRNGDPVPVVATWEGAEIEGGLNSVVRVTLPAVQFDGDTPGVSDDGIVAVSLPFTVRDNGSDEVVTVEYQTTDATP